MNRLFRVIVTIGVLLIAIEVSSYLYCRIYSQSIASDMIQKLCQEQGYDPTKLSGPIDAEVGNRPASYSWRYKDSAHNLELLVSFDYFYNAKIARWDYDRKD